MVVMEVGAGKAVAVTAVEVAAGVEAHQLEDLSIEL